MTEVSQAVWTDADFAQMGWHDCRVHAAALVEDDDDLPPGRLLLDLDYIVRWVEPARRRKHFTFWIAPATLVFDQAWDITGTLGPCTAAWRPQAFAQGADAGQTAPMVSEYAQGTAIETRWAATLDRARLLPEGKLHERVDGEWSFGETQRHLLFASDAWLGNAVLEEEAPYHSLGLPAGGMPPEDAAKLGLTLEATPTLDEVLAPRLARMAAMRRVVGGLTPAGLDRVCGRKPADPYPDEEYVVRRCLKVVLKEEAEHHRYATRDLAVLEAGQP
ncbi:DinB family protein [Amycolatopsis sp. NPDC049688]|uniref:DinB family protein n=1 Tax=Amycolatopsis sp. NPDC049688 TaxID=3154733 RepID=UPI0034411823